MKKKILMIVSVLLIAVLMIPLTGCSSLENSQSVPSDVDIYDMQWSNMFEKVGSDRYIVVYRETTTDVMYMQYSERMGYAGSGGLTVMLDINGTPLLYSKWVARQDGFAPESSNPSNNATKPTAPETAVQDTCVICGTQCDTTYCPNCGTKQ